MFIAVAVDIIRFQSYGLQDNVALLVLLHRKGQLDTMLWLNHRDACVALRLLLLSSCC